MLEAASSAVRSYCEWHIAPSLTHTVTVEASAGVILLPTLQLTDVVSVTSVVSGSSPLDLANLSWKPNGIVSGLGCGEYVVEFIHGYDATPAELLRLVTAAASVGSTKVGALQQVGQVRYAADSAATSSAVSPDELAILNRYRLPPRP